MTFLSDYGLADEFVGVCHGVIKRIAPDADVLDVTHGVAPQQVLEGALVLQRSIPYLPVGVHLAVVDPGVGSARRAVALRGAEGRIFVGPDNGLLLLAADPTEATHELANPEYRLEPVSATFHGRDVFAPAAAYLARGVPLEELGPAVDPRALVRVEVPEPEVDGERIRATCLLVDRFGNVQLNARSLELGPRTVVDADGRRLTALKARTFADVPAGELIVYENSGGWLALAVSGGSAADLLGVRPGMRIELTP